MTLLNWAGEPDREAAHCIESRYNRFMADCILNVSANQALRDTRFRILSNAGFSVVSVMTAPMAEEILKSREEIAVAVIGDTIPKREREHLARIAKGQNIPVLFIEAVPVPAEKSAADAVIPRLGDPEQLVEAVFRLSQQRTKATQA